MADSNWIKVNRSIWGNFLWDFEKPKYPLAWVDMLLMANYKDKKIMFDGKVEVVKRGSFITSMVKLSERWKMDRATVKRYLDTLQNDGMITYKCNNRRTVITIVNYSLFQGFDSEYTTAEPTTDSTTGATTNSTTDTTAEPTTDSTQHKKVKKVKEIKESKKGKEVKKSYTDDDELNKAILSFVEYRKNIKKPMSDHAVALLLKKLNGMTAYIPEQIEIINQSIVNGWQGVFPLKEKQQNNTMYQKPTKADELDQFYAMANDWADS